MLRKKKFKSFRKNKEALDLDITSLLDILVILLVFLLKSYNASDLKLDLVKNMLLPQSISRTLGNNAVIIQVNKDRSIWVNYKQIGELDNNEKVEILFSTLTEIKKQEKEKIDNVRVLASDITEQNKQINIVLDKSLPYKVLRQIMHTSALAGYPNFKFIVEGNY